MFSPCLPYVTTQVLICKPRKYTLLAVSKKCHFYANPQHILKAGSDTEPYLESEYDQQSLREPLQRIKKK